MGVSSSESHDLTAFYEMLSASFGVLSQNTGFYPSLDRIIETTLGPLNLGPGGGAYNEPISRLQRKIQIWIFMACTVVSWGLQDLLKLVCRSVCCPPPPRWDPRIKSRDVSILVHFP